MARPLSVREKRGRVLMGGSGEGQGVACVGGQPLPFIYPIAGCPLPQPPLLPKLEASLRFSHTHQSKDNSRCFLDYAYIFLNMQAEGSENCYILFNGFLRPPLASHTPTAYVWGGFKGWDRHWAGHDRGAKSGKGGRFGSWRWEGWGWFH